MVDEKLRAAIAQYCEERGLEGDELPLLFDNHAYDRSIVGISTDGRIVYNLGTMVAELMDDEGWSYEEAIEWLDYNTLNAHISNGKAPLIVDLSRDDLLERYGEVGA